MLNNLRARWRIFCLSVHVLRGILTVALVFPIINTRKQRQIKQAWSLGLLNTLNIDIAASGEIQTDVALIVSNHISWLDVFVINALSQTHFVCKEEVRHWPVLGWLTQASNTVFIARGTHSGTARTKQDLILRLRNNESVAVFPESTTTRGDHLLPFKPALFQAAIEANVAVQPVALRYLNSEGELCASAAYIDGISLWQSLLNIVQLPQLSVHATFLPRLSGDNQRRDLATQSHEIIAKVVFGAN